MLKQTSRAQFLKLSGCSIEWGFKCSNNDTYMMISVQDGVFFVLLIYIDDILIIGNDPTFSSNLISHLNNVFLLKDLGDINFFLGIEITKIYDKVQLKDSKPSSTPMIVGTPLSKSDGIPFSNAIQFKTIIRALQYYTLTCLEISFLVNNICQFLHQPTDKHWLATKRLFRYLKGTLDYGISLSQSSSLSLTTYIDVDYASWVDYMRSTCGYYIYLG